MTIFQNILKSGYKDIDSNSELIIQQLVSLALSNDDSRLSVESKIVLSEFMLDNVLIPSIKLRTDSFGNYHAKPSKSSSPSIITKQVLYLILSP